MSAGCCPTSTCAACYLNLPFTLHCLSLQNYQEVFVKVLAMDMEMKQREVYCPPEHGVEELWTNCIFSGINIEKCDDIKDLTSSLGTWPSAPRTGSRHP